MRPKCRRQQENKRRGETQFLLGGDGRSPALRAAVGPEGPEITRPPNAQYGVRCPGLRPHRTAGRRPACDRPRSCQRPWRGRAAGVPLRMRGELSATLRQQRSPLKV
jgi:hypothetical protein